MVHQLLAATLCFSDGDEGKWMRSSAAELGQPEWGREAGMAAPALQVARVSSSGARL